MDNWNILLESTSDGFTVATVIEAPDCQIRDETKQGAVEKVQELLQKRLAKAEIIKIPVPIQPMPKENSLMKFAGIFHSQALPGNEAVQGNHFHELDIHIIVNL